MTRPNVVKLVGVDSKNGEINAVYISHELSGYKGKFVPDRPRGEWNTTHNPNHSPFDSTSEVIYMCSRCAYSSGDRITATWNFCPNCGARMISREVTENECKGN